MALDFPAIDPVAISVGPLVVRWYALAYLAGFLGGWKYILYLVGKYQTEEQRPNVQDIDDFVPWVIIGVIFGGRLGYVLFYNLPYFLTAPHEILYIWEGGMSFHGGALMVIFAMIGFSIYRKVPLLRLTDLVCAAVPIGVFFGRITNFINGELYGRVSEVPWAVKFPAGDYLPRHPSQLYESALEGFVLFWILFFAFRNEKIREKHGIVSAIFLIGYGVFRMIVELFREPDEQLGFIFAHISMGQILCLPMIAFALCLIAYVLRRDRQAAYS